MSIKGASAVAAKCLILALPAGTALADQDVLKVFANASFRFDNNLFRLPDDVDPAQKWAGVKPGRSDAILGLNAGVQVDKPYGQQRLKLSASLGSYRYATHHHLDFTANEYRASWEWHLTPRLSGRLSAEQSQTLYSFVNNQDFQRNVLTRQSQNLDADWWFGSDWHALFGVGRQVYEGSVQVQQDRDYTALRWEAGLRYDRDKVGSASLKLRRSDADYSTRSVNFVTRHDNRFEQREFEFGMQYAITGRSNLDGRLAWLERSHPNIPLRDYSGWVGRLGWTWDLTGALRLSTEYRRELESWQDANSNHVVSDRLSIGPTWAYTAKQRLDLQLEGQERRHEGALPSAALPLRKDSILALNLSATWAPIQAVSVNAAWRREERDSNINGFDYSDDSLTLAVQGLF